MAANVANRLADRANLTFIMFIKVSVQSTLGSSRIELLMLCPCESKVRRPPHAVFKID